MFADMSGNLAGRLVSLYAGLVAFGVSLALMARANLGVGPWDVLHLGLAGLLDVRLGWVTIAVSLLVLLAWLPLRERPGLGTVSNAVLVGLVVNAALDLLTPPESLAARVTWLCAGIVLNAVATALYLGADLGAGPRDGLMTGLARRGHSVRVVRTVIELSVLTAGFALGGPVGVGTLAFAVAIGPLTHYLLPRLAIRPGAPTGGVRQR